MPEGPEIRRAADELAAAIAGQRVTKVLFAFDHLKPYASHLQGETVCQVTARGKAILTRFSNDLGRATTLCKQGRHSKPAATVPALRIY